MKKYVFLCVAGMCISNKLCAMYNGTFTDTEFGILDEVVFAQAVTSDFTESAEKTIFEYSVTERLMLLFDIASKARANLPPESANSTYLGNMKAIIHFVVTGDILSETKANKLISDEFFFEEYAQYLPAHISLMRSVGCAPQIEFGAEELRSLAQATLDAQDKLMKRDVCSLNILSLVSARLAGHKK